MLDILSILPGKKKTTNSGWTTFNAICCHHRGHSADTRMRGGLKDEGGTQLYHCFNCGFNASFTLGETISGQLRSLLLWCGIEYEQIQRWSLQSLQQRGMLSYISSKEVQVKKYFDSIDLPPNAVMLDHADPHHEYYSNYIIGRGLNPRSYPYMVTPDDSLVRNRNRIIIPYTHNNKVVGYTSRYLDNKSPKFINVQQSGYVFGLDFQRQNWQSVIVVEGIFDALSIDGCALMHETISNEQAQLLASLRRRVIVVPDQDKTGINIINRSLDLGYQVSIPPWANDIKDANDAVRKYGKVATLLSILQYATSSKIKLDISKRKLKRKFE